MHITGAVLAGITEVYDRELFEFTGRLFSGQSMKHLLAALGSLALLIMVKRWRPIEV